MLAAACLFKAHFPGDPRPAGGPARETKGGELCARRGPEGVPERGQVVPGGGLTWNGSSELIVASYSGWVVTSIALPSVYRQYCRRSSCLPPPPTHLPQLRPHLGASNLKSSYIGPSYRRQTPALDRTPGSPPLEQRKGLPSGDPGGTGPSPFVFWSVAGAAACGQQATAPAPREPGQRRNSAEGIAAPRGPEDEEAEGTSALSTPATAIGAASCDTGAPTPTVAPPPQTGVHGGQAAGVDGAAHLNMASPPIRWIWCCGAACF